MKKAVTVTKKESHFKVKTPTLLCVSKLVHFWSGQVPEVSLRVDAFGR